MARSARHLLTRRPRSTVVVAVVTAALTLQVLGANPAVSQSQALTAYRATDGPGLDPTAGVWSKAPAIEVPLTSRRVFSPLGEPIAMLETQAVHSEGVLYILMSWDDDTRDTRIVGVDQFADAAAVEFPARAGSSVPALCMGQTDGGVNIWHWRAGNQEGLPESIEDLSAGGYVDRYPATEDLYFPARAAENPVALSHPVQDLVAVGFGTLTPAVDQAVQGTAVWENGRWSVVFARELSHQAAEHVDLGEGASADIAFAVWDGSEGERDGVKSISQFVVLDVAAEGFPRTTAVWLVIMFGSLLGIGAFALLVGTAFERAANRGVRRDPAATPA